MGDGGGAHACLVCEYTAGHAVAHGCGHAVPYAAPQGRLGGDGARHDALQRLGNGRPVAISTITPPPINRRAMQGTRVSLTRPMRPMPPRITSPVSTATTSPTASRSQPKAASREAAMELACTRPPPGEAATQLWGKQGGQRPAAHSPTLHVAHGAALPAAVSAFLPVAHRQGLFYTSGHHAQKGGHPHPEHRPRPAVEDGSSHPGDGASANGGGQGGGQGLELGKPPALPPPLRTEQGAQRGFEPQPDVKELKEAGPHRKIQAASKSEAQQPRVPDKISQSLGKGHVHTPLLHICRRGEEHVSLVKGGFPLYNRVKRRATSHV